MSDAILVKTEKALISWLETFAGEGGALEGVTFFEGHGAETMAVVPRIIVTALSAGGDLADAGVFELPVQVQAISASDDAAGQSPRADALLEIFSLEELPELLQALNAPESGPDTRAVKGFGISGIERETLAEGRDSEKNLHGSVLPLRVWAHLEN